MQGEHVHLCSQERFLVEKQLHVLACEEVEALRDRQQHETDYHKQEVAQVLFTAVSWLCLKHLDMSITTILPSPIL